MRQEPSCDYEWSMFWLVPIKTRNFKTVREIRVYLWCSWDWLHGRWRRHVFMFPRFTCVSDIVCRPSCWSVRTQLSWPGPPPSTTITRPVIGPLFLSFITHRWLRHKTDSEMPRAAPTASYYINTLRLYVIAEIIQNLERKRIPIALLEDIQWLLVFVP